MKRLFSLLLLSCALLCSCGSTTNYSREDNSEINEEEPNSQINSETETEPNNDVDIYTISDEEFMSQCSEKWHDDIFFSKDDLEGQYVKLDLFIEENYFFTIDDMTSNYSVRELVDKYGVQRDFFKCGVNRPDNSGYMSGQISLYFPEQSGISADSFSVGDHVTVYGKIIEYSTNTWDGYNGCWVIPKRVLNNGQ